MGGENLFTNFVRLWLIMHVTATFHMGRLYSDANATGEVALEIVENNDHVNSPRNISLVSQASIWIRQHSQ